MGNVTKSLIPIATTAAGLALAAPTGGASVAITPLGFTTGQLAAGATGLGLGLSAIGANPLTNLFSSNRSLPPTPPAPKTPRLDEDETRARLNAAEEQERTKRRRVTSTLFAGRTPLLQQQPADPSLRRLFGA